jgi:hypothetical protein
MLVVPKPWWVSTFIDDGRWRPPLESRDAWFDWLKESPGYSYTETFGHFAAGMAT